MAVRIVYLNKFMSRFGVTATYVDTNDLDGLEAASHIRIRKRLVLKHRRIR